MHVTKFVYFLIQKY